VAKVDLSRLSPLSIAASVGGVALGAYAALDLVLPALFAGVAWFVLHKMGPTAKKPVVPAVAWQLGQFGWFVVGLAFVPAGLMQVGPDVVILGGLLIWLYISLGRIAAWSLIAYQGLSSLLNIWLFLHAPIESSQAKALAVHIVWRVTAICLLVLFIRRQPAAAETARTFE
jgi:hypothetical protein